MPLECRQCHTPNGEQLRVCAACGAALPSPAAASTAGAAPRLDHDSDTFDALYAPTLMMGAGQGASDDRHADELPPPRQRPMPKPSRRSTSLVLLGAVAAFAIAGAWWRLAPMAPSSSLPAALPASAAAAPSASIAASGALPPAISPASGAAPASAASPAAAAPAAASGAASAAHPAMRASGASPVAPPPRPTSRVRKPAVAAAAPSSAASAAPEPQGAAADAPAQSTSVPLAESAAAGAAEARVTAQQICASRNFFLRSYCEANECGKPEHADEAHCRKLQEAAPRRPGR